VRCRRDSNEPQRERYHRAAPLPAIGEGSNELQRLVVCDCRAGRHPARSHPPVVEDFMTITLSPVLVVLGGMCVFLLGIAMSVWTRRPIIQRLETDRRALQDELGHVRSQLATSQEDRQALEAQLARMREELASGASRNEQLRDLVKIHVARRREFDEWAGPIKASLGETVGQALRTLQEQSLRQESMLQHQQRRVAETQDRYRAKTDEIERMRQELSIKNYHIAALNERFIRIEERIGDLATLAAHARAGTLPAASAPSDSAQPTARQLPLDMIDKPAAEWTQLLAEWHERLDRRFEQLDALQAGLQPAPAGGAATVPPPPAESSADETSPLR
jgi:hypothetical protein